MKNLHILTLSWNGADKLDRLKTSLVKEKLPNDVNFIWHIKDNGSVDNSVELIQSWQDDRIKVYPVGHNRDSFSKGVNFLFEKANPNPEDLILLLNNDVTFDTESSSSLNKMISLLKGDVGAVGCRLLYPGTNKLQHAGVIFHPTYRTPYHFRCGDVSDNNSEKNRYFQAVTGACLLTKAESFRNAGHMDEKYQWAFEDIDLCLSIGLKEKIVYCGNAKVFHEESASLKKNPIHKMFMQSNLSHFFKKWNGKYSIDTDLYTKDPLYNVIK